MQSSDKQNQIGTWLKEHTWWSTLADVVGFSQPCVAVAGQVMSNHLTFSQECYDDWDGDGWDQDGHQELPLVVSNASLDCVCKRQKDELLLRLWELNSTNWNKTSRTETRTGHLYGWQATFQTSDYLWPVSMS